MASSFASQCSELKTTYDDCFNDWYANEFLKGRGKSVNPCEDVFKEYKSCLESALSSKGLSQMLEDARKDHPFHQGNETKSNS